MATVSGSAAERRARLPGSLPDENSYALVPLVRDEHGLFRLCGDLGLYLERNSIGRTSGGSGKDLYGVFRELKKKKDILLQMKSEWNSLSGTMERLWGRSGEFLPSRGENWDDASTALYGELEQFILRVLGVGQEKELEALLKEFPFLREKDFLFGDEVGNTAVPRSVTGGVPLGVKILAAGHSFPDGFLTGGEGEQCLRTKCISASSPLRARTPSPQGTL